MATALKVEPRTSYICRVKENPCKVYFTTIGGVSFERYRLKPGKKGEPAQGVAPTHQLTKAEAKYVQDVIDNSVMRPGTGVVKLVRTTCEADQHGNVVNVRRLQPGTFDCIPMEGDEPLAGYLQFEATESSQVATLQAEIKRLTDALDAERAQSRKDEDEELQEAETKLGRKPGPRNKKKV